MSLRPIGMPCNGPRYLPAAISASAARAAPRASSASTRMKLLSRPSSRAMRSSRLSTSSTGDSSFFFDQPRRLGDRQEIRDHRSGLREAHDMRRLGRDIAPAGRAQPRLHILEEVSPRRSRRAPSPARRARAGPMPRRVPVHGKKGFVGVGGVPPTQAPPSFHYLLPSPPGAGCRFRRGGATAGEGAQRSP